MIREKTITSKDNDLIKRIPLKIKRLFSIREKYFFNCNIFIKTTDFQVNKFYISRLPFQRSVNLNEYNPRVINLLGDNIKFTTNDLLT